MVKSKRPNAAVKPGRARARIALLAAAVLALVAGISTPPAHAQPPAWDAADLEAFVDPIIAQGMAENHISRWRSPPRPAC
jgi:hypothetical protein